MNIDQLKGSFSNAVAISNVGDLSAPNDMMEEITAALRGGSTGHEEYVLYASWRYSSDPESTKFVFFPKAQRGAVCAGGLSEWTDCSDLDDLEGRWLSIGTDNNTWSN